MLWPGGNFKAELLAALPPVHAQGAAGLQRPSGTCLGSNLSMSRSTVRAPWQTLPSLQPQTVPQDPHTPGKYYPWECSNAAASESKQKRSARQCYTSCNIQRTPIFFFLLTRKKEGKKCIYFTEVTCIQIPPSSPCVSMRQVISIIVNEIGTEHRPVPSYGIVHAVKQSQCCPSLAGTFHFMVHGGSMGRGQSTLSRLDVVSWFGGIGALKPVHASPHQLPRCQRAVAGPLCLLVQMQPLRPIKRVLQCSCSQICP